MGDNDVLWDDFVLVDDFYDDLVLHEDDEQPQNQALPITPSTLSPTQERALSILLVISATFSALGSASIAYKILRDKQQLSKPYHRTMLALSVADVIASLTFGLYPFLMPSETRIWSFGNHASCNTLGFFTQLSFAAIGYNCILSFYYLLAIKFNMKKMKFSQRYEKPMHLLNLSFFLITASVGAVYQFYGPVGKYHYIHVIF
jgi:Kef-type K+ transport system membrane component KefB